MGHGTPRGPPFRGSGSRGDLENVGGAGARSPLNTCFSVSSPQGSTLRKRRMYEKFLSKVSILGVCLPTRCARPGHTCAHRFRNALACADTRTHVLTRADTHTHAHTYRHTHMLTRAQCTHVHTGSDTRSRVQTHAHTCAHVQTCAHTCTRMLTCVQCPPTHAHCACRRVGPHGHAHTHCRASASAPPCCVCPSVHHRSRSAHAGLLETGLETCLGVSSVGVPCFSRLGV